MAITLDPMLKNILDAPVGEVEKTLKDLLKCEVFLSVIEQNQLRQTQFLRKIIITANELPIIRATVKFDLKNLPDNISSELLRKKDGIGTILSRNNIVTQRKIISLDFDDERKTVHRNYEIVYNNDVWFEICEEIRLDYLASCKNS
jgi:chorismate-pyruvate lyase